MTDNERNQEIDFYIAQFDSLVEWQITDIRIRFPKLNLEEILDELIYNKKDS